MLAEALMVLGDLPDGIAQRPDAEVILFSPSKEHTFTLDHMIEQFSKA